MTAAGGSTTASASRVNIAESGHTCATSAATFQPAQRVGVDHSSALSWLQRPDHRSHASANTARAAPPSSRIPPNLATPDYAGVEVGNQPGIKEAS
ncbi:hypothetical protein MPUL_53000 [Mycolicibacterium pulveris]|uniref:Uncharacterized protein n=1 Tax=Mycolicibacterium pulveris TaxID=36813 RepID=A0A7I7URT4_MYCPV|nr:hypothetical protein MPUL_53000 [Mycolicibacterium pulveris]